MTDKIEATREELTQAFEELGLGIGGGDHLFEHFKAKAAKPKEPAPEHADPKGKDPDKRL